LRRGKTTLKILCISDLHGETPDLQPAVEDNDISLVLLAGDYNPCGKWDLINEKKWLDQVFAPWLEKLRDRVTVYGTWGNHDFVSWQFHYTGEFALPKVCQQVMLIDDSANYGGYKIYGTPRQKGYKQYAWTHSEAELSIWYDRHIPDDVDILITHGPPFTVMDKTNEGTHCGSQSLIKRMLELEKLKLSLFGHIHHSYGYSEQLGWKCVNAAHMTTDLRPINAPIIVEI
jgi:Icc-related predicted phosphoesterase